MADGNVVDIESSSEVAELLAVYERQDASERYAWEPIETAYIEQEQSEELIEAKEAMDEDNRKLIQKLYFEGVPARTIAAQKQITFQVVYR